MNDLLSSVKPAPRKQRGRDDEVEEDVDEEEGIAPPPSERQLEMKEFFAAVAPIKTSMAAISTLQEEMLRMHENSKTGLVKSKDIRRHQDLMGEKIATIGKLANDVKTKLEDLDKQNELAKKKPGCGEGSASERTRTTVTSGLKRKLKDCMVQYNDMRDKIHAENRTLVEKRIYTVTQQHVSPEQVDAIIESGESEQIFQKAFMQQGQGLMLSTLAEIQERSAAIKNLEASMLELHQIFLDMAALVEAQGEMLNNIEQQVTRAKDHIQKGTVNLQEAKQLQKNTRKWMCCAIVIMLIVALIIVLVVVKPWKFLSK